MFKKITLAIAALVVLYSCQNEDELINQFNTSEPTSLFEFSVSTQDVTGLFSRNTDTACSSTDLIAGQNYDAGRVDVEIVNEDGVEYVYITYITEGDWILKLTHLYAGDRDGIPETKKGNPKPGVFEKRVDYSANVISDFEIEYKILADAFEDCFYIAAHAEVEKVDGSQSETAWG
ncbi:MAG: hypothetical protein COA67_07680 [Lutibacter sp.]|nr:MAG: hypothetical protein COA67_07680 [Lutibacter sp.]